MQELQTPRCEVHDLAVGFQPYSMDLIMIFLRKMSVISLFSAAILACNETPVQAQLASVPAVTADAAFAAKFCDTVVDSLQQGSYHWMACHSTVDELLSASISQTELVEKTCKAIEDTFYKESSLAACIDGGKRLVVSEGYSKDQKDFFSRTASSIVACYENVGTVQPGYDEEGRCSDDSGLSAWTMTSTLDVKAELASFTQLDSRVSTVGDYAGSVSFFNHKGRRCTFDLTASYSGEDILVSTSNFFCR